VKCSASIWRVRRSRARSPEIERADESPIKRVTSAAAISLLTLFLTLTSTKAGVSATVTLSPGADVQAAISSNAAGTTFSFNAGIYRMQSIAPLTGDRFIGQTGADLNGSKLARNWVRVGRYWISSGNPELTKPFKSGHFQRCQDPTSGCAYPQDLYVNNKPLVHQLALPIVSVQLVL